MARTIGLKIGDIVPTPIHEWKLSQASISGGTASDTGSSPVNATIVNTLIKDDSPAGLLSALRSDVSGHLSLPSSCLPTLTAPHTWSAWVRLSNLDALSPNGSTQQTYYSDYKDATNGAKVCNYRAAGTPGRFKVCIYKTGGNVFYMTDAQAAKGNNYETHLGYTWDGSTVVIYVDGKAVAASTTTTDVKPDGNYIMARTATLGQIDGTLANVRIWNVVLNSWEMRSVYEFDRAGQATPYGGIPMGQLRFQDNFYGTGVCFGKWLPNWYGANNTVVTVPANRTYEKAAYDPAQLTLADNSELSITTNNVPITLDVTYNYRTGCIMSRSKFDYRRGYYEVKAYLPSADTVNLDNWPGIWTNGEHTVWPDGVENDILEGMSGSPVTHYHAPDGAGGDVNHTHNWGLDVKNGWHYFGCRSDLDVVEYYFDGTKIDEINAPDAINKLQWAVLVFAVSNQGNPGGPIVVGSVMKCDWIRYWEPT